MPRATNLWECNTCGRVFQSWLLAAQCEEGHTIETPTHKEWRDR